MIRDSDPTKDRESGACRAGSLVAPGEPGSGRQLRAGDLLQYQVVVVIPAYNEERFIGSVVLKVRRFATTVIVVDDGSSDDTARLAEDGGALVLKHPENRGKAAALNTALRAAQDYAPDVVVMLDADGQHRPEELARVVAPVVQGQADIVVGSRYLERTSDVPPQRVWGHRIFNLLTHLASGVRLSDSQSGYRAFSPRALEVIHFGSDGFSVESEMQFLAREHDLRLDEVPITIRYLDKPKRSLVAHGMSVLDGVLRLTGQYRPLLSFCLPGLVSFVAGVLLGLRVIERFNQVHQLAIGSALLCVLLCVTGLILMTTGFSLHSIRNLLTSILDKFRDG